MIASGTTVTKYVRVETIISMVINAVISAGFTWFGFGGQAFARMWGAKGVAIDFLPQTFMISLMSVVVPTVLTRRRLSAGSLEVSGPRSRLPANVLARAALVAVVATLIISVVAIGVLAAAGVETVPFLVLLPAKIIYGALVALVVTPIAVRAALGDPIKADAALT